VDAEDPASAADRAAPGQEPVAEEDIILRHATRAFRLATKRA
jgi:hypothetical protein